jgi:hypothetical protein
VAFATHKFCRYEGTARKNAVKIMFSSELWFVLKQVVSSWQVIAMAVVVILYLSLLNFATNMNKKPKPKAAAKIKKLKRPPKTPTIDKNLDTGSLGIDE